MVQSIPYFHLVFDQTVDQNSFFRYHILNNIIIIDLYELL